MSLFECSLLDFKMKIFPMWVDVVNRIISSELVYIVTLSKMPIFES
jgi:hypothetical protein